MVLLIRFIICLDNAPYAALERKHHYNPYSKLCGVIPPSKEYYTTTTKIYNKDLEDLISNKSGKDEFYHKEQGLKIIFIFSIFKSRKRIFEEKY